MDYSSQNFGMRLYVVGNNNVGKTQKKKLSKKKKSLTYFAWLFLKANENILTEMFASLKLAKVILNTRDIAIAYSESLLIWWAQWAKHVTGPYYSQVPTSGKAQGL